MKVKVHVFLSKLLPNGHRHHTMHFACIKMNFITKSFTLSLNVIDYFNRMLDVGRFVVKFIISLLYCAQPHSC